MLCTFGRTVVSPRRALPKRTTVSPAAVHRLERPLCAPLKSHLIRCVQSHSPGAHTREGVGGGCGGKNAKCQREEREWRKGEKRERRRRLRSSMRGDSPTRRSQTKRQSRIQVVCVRGGCCRHITPPAAAVAVTAAAAATALQLHSTHDYTIYCVRFQCLPRDGDRPAAPAPSQLHYNNSSSSNTLLHFYYPPESAHCTLFAAVYSPVF